MVCLMDPKGDGAPLRTSDRLRKRPKYFARGFVYYSPAIRKKIKPKKHAAASQIVKKIMRPRPAQSQALERRGMQHAQPVDSIAANLRRSTRKRKMAINLEDYEANTSTSEDDDLMTPGYCAPKVKVENNNATHDGVYMSTRIRKPTKTKMLPRREGLRPRRSSRVQRLRHYHESDDDPGTSDSPTMRETENGNASTKDVGDEEDADAGDEAEDGDDEEGEEGEDGEEEQDGRRRYDLRNRNEVRRMSPEKEKQSTRSPRRVLHHGMGPKNTKYLKKGGSRGHNRPRYSIHDDYSDDSLLVDELDQGPSFPWLRGGSSRSGNPWLFGALDVQSSTAWGLNVAASGWSHQGEPNTLMAGMQTAVGPSSKGGADIQPLQVDESVSFSDIGGLSDYIDALKEMVFFPLLYPDFFASYHITPPRGVLLCGPPGTGKTLIARALACAASKAGQKVSFYMRKGADVLSKWVGEAERQLKMLFEEAQRNQPSIIFFDEIDGLAPVRSSKQEQIHNSIVSTLLALMDGLDSRGQVVLIGATNRIDAIDGALRRPGRFDREFFFPLPGYEARAEILNIHTRKWKEPPTEALKMELAASCVGYCGADLKALCTEAAIRAFREKYPQVYTSDEKFVIDIDSVKVQKYHFLEAMSAITPAAHRGSVVYSRPLSPVVTPCLKRHLNGVMERIRHIYPFVLSSEVAKLSSLSYGSSVPLVYRPRLLVCGDNEAVGLDHVGPAVLHELEKFSIHSLGLPSLISDPSAKTPEEALVHIFGEARRATPSILYLPQFHLWWETAHEQLRAVLLTLLEEVPSNLPLLLLATSFVTSEEHDVECHSIFTPHDVYRVDRPTTEDRSAFFDSLFDAVLSIQKERPVHSSEKSFAELPRAPVEMSAPKASELRAKAEAEQHALRRLRMCLRDVCNRVLYDKRFVLFHYPVMEDQFPDYRTIIQNPMDMATLLQKVDEGQYLTRDAFVKDFDLIALNAKIYNGEDYNGARIVSRACELRDVVQGMLSQMDPALVAFCDKISARGGPLHLEDDESGSVLQNAPLLQVGPITRTSARLRNVQLDINFSQSSIKRQKKGTADGEQQGPANDSMPSGGERSPAADPDSATLSPSHCQPEEPDLSHATVVLQSADNFPPAEPPVSLSEFAANADFSGELQPVKERLMMLTEGFGVPQLERVYTMMIRDAIEAKENRDEVCPDEGPRKSVVRFLAKFSEDWDDKFF